MVSDDPQVVLDPRGGPEWTGASFDATRERQALTLAALTPEQRLAWL